MDRVICHQIMMTEKKVDDDDELNIWAARITHSFMRTAGDCKKSRRQHSTAQGRRSRTKILKRVQKKIKGDLK